MSMPEPWVGFEWVAGASLPARPELGELEAQAVGAALNRYLHLRDRLDLDEPALLTLSALLQEWAVPHGRCLAYGAPPGTPAMVILGRTYRVGPPPDSWPWYAVVDARAGQIHLYRRLELD